MSDARSLHVGVVQLAARYDRVHEQLARVDAMLRRHRADLVLLPELALTGYVSEVLTFDLEALAEPLDGPTARHCAALARMHRVAVAAPLVEDDGGALYNSLLLFDAHGARIGHWRKRHPWYPERWATRGNLGTPVVTLGGVRLCAAICFDIHFVAREADDALARSDLLLFPSAWVEHPDTRPARLAQLAQRAGVAIANANWGLGEPAVYGQGASGIFDARGTLVARTPDDSGDAWCDAALTFPAAAPAAALPETP